MVWATLFQLKHEARMEAAAADCGVISFVRFALLG